MAFFVGGFVILYVITRLVERAFKDKRESPQAVFVSTLVALGVATVIGGVGLADGGPPVFVAAFQAYVLPALAVLAVETVRLTIKSRKKVR